LPWTTLGGKAGGKAVDVKMSTLPWHCLGTALALPGHCLGTAWALPWHCLGTAWALPGHCLGTAWALPWHCLGTCLGTALALSTLRLGTQYLYYIVYNVMTLYTQATVTVTLRRHS
jgi:hypothetical protein